MRSLKNELLDKSMIGTFRSLAECIHKENKELLNNIRNFKEPKAIDPTTIKIQDVKLTESQKAFMLARKYMKEDPSNTLRTIWQHNRKRQMSKANIKFVNDIVAKIKAKITEGLP